MERLEALVYGRVQTVTYRDFAQRKARGLGIVGEVTNLRDGSVRVIAEGPRDQLERYLVKLHQGPFFARVKSVTHVWSETTGKYDRFSITYL